MSTAAAPLNGGPMHLSLPGNMFKIIFRLAVLIGDATN
jgi:hypothetical protein